MEESLVSPPPAEFVNRRAGLILFGVLELIIGFFCALLVPLLFVGLALATQAASAPPEKRMIVLAACSYGAASIVFAWLGIGSILCRRWARALLLILAWSWFIAGVCAVPLFLWSAPQIAGQGAAGLSGSGFMAITIVILSAIVIVLPGGMALFYQSKNVKATCEALDPVRRWTDACPPTVLATSLWFLVSAVLLLVMPLAYPSVLPFFGVLVTGRPATMALLSLAVLWIYLAWETYRLRSLGWWGTLIALVLMSVSAVVTFARIDPMEVCRQMGYSEQQIDQMRNLAICSGRNIALWTSALTVLFMGYMLSIRKHFAR